MFPGFSTAVNKLMWIFTKAFSGTYSPLKRIFVTNPSSKVNNTTHKKNAVSSLPVSINDLRDNEFSGVRLSQEEKQALENFDHYRIQYLNSSSNEEEFSNRYLEMQAKANLSPYTEFLKPPYSGQSLNN